MRSVVFVIGLVFFLFWTGAMKVFGEELPAAVEETLAGTEGTGPGGPSMEGPLRGSEGTGFVAPSPAEVIFDVNGFQVEGNTILPLDQIETVLSSYRGTGKKLEEMENARLALEGGYREAGYPAVLVIVPEQTLENGIVRLAVVESKVGLVRVTGNRYFTEDEILFNLPSLEHGAMLHEPSVLREMNAVNANPDLEVAPVLHLGEEPGTVDLELKVEDRLPLHGSLEWNNRGTPNTPRQRLNGSIQYANLFHRDHSLSFQTTQTPEDFGGIQVYGLNYLVPLERDGHLLALYGVWSKSQSVLDGASLPVVAGDIQVAGNAVVLGARYLFPLSGEEEKRFDQLALGIDFRGMDKSEADFPGGLGTALISNRIQYTPVSVAYTGLRPDDGGITKWNALFKGYAAGMVSKGGEEEFGGDPSDPAGTPGNRKGASGTFGVVQAGMERDQKLPGGGGLTLKGEGQWATEPLISAEQYYAGGVESVRGYQENEASGDRALRGSVEWTFPLKETITAEALKGELMGVLFYDAAVLWTLDPFPGQDGQRQLEGAGFGLRGRFPHGVQLSVDQAWAMRNGVLTGRRDPEIYFSVKWLW